MNNQFSENDNHMADTSDNTEFSSVEYFKSLEKWVQDVTFWQYFNSVTFHSFLINQTATARLSGATPGAPPGPRRAPRRPVISRPERIRGIECRVPSLWKRLVAEFIDFMCLFFVKLLATFILVDFLDIIDWNRYDFDSLIQRTWRLDYSAAVELTSELMIVEFAHRITVCIFESFWLYRGLRGVIGGATPGKKLMHLRVVYCERITTIRTEPDFVVLIEPGTDLGILRASVRSFIKNFILALFLPFTFVCLYFQYNRATHDVIAQSIVIEEPVRYQTE
ncbi:protein FAM8A1-like [Planococcus citri]|uniref:protein FAM8A1-like n=1 Tax=Planococcus citri TaxID=170843 RepID=UPI0031F76475